MTTLIFHNESASNVGPGGAYKLVSTVGGASASDKTNNLTGPVGWGELRAAGNAAAWPGLAQAGTPSNFGWCYDAADMYGKMFEQSNKWADQLQLNRVGASVVADVVRHYFVYDDAAVSFTKYAEVLFSNLTIPSGSNTFSQSNLLLPEMRFPTTHSHMYTDLWMNNKTTGASGTLAVIQSTGADVGGYTTYLTAPDAVTIYNHQYYVSLLGASLIPYLKYQPKPLPRVKSSDEVTHGLVESPSCLFDTKFFPVADQLQVQMNYAGSGSWPVLSLYRMNTTGSQDEILHVADNNLYTVNRNGYQGWNYNEGNSHVLAVVRHTQPKTIDLSIKSVLP
jgi:hypothetical protein